MEINSKTKLYCIFGRPVRHSLSPVIHNRAFNEFDINAVYLAFEPGSIQDAIESMKKLHIAGASVTIPFKVDVMKHIDAIDGLAEKIGSVNTLIQKDGVVSGYNTDGHGALLALQKNDVPINGSKVLVIGNGGSARAIAFTLLEEHADVIIAGRNVQRIRELTGDLHEHHRNADSILLSDLDRQFMDSIDIIINTTPVGMAPDTGSMPVDGALIQQKHTVFDIVYAPDMTTLLHLSSRKGCGIIKGIEMLIYQGIKQFELWTGKQAPYTVVYNALQRHMRQ